MSGRVILEELGWNDFFAGHFAPFEGQGFVPGRLILETKINYRAILAGGEEVDCVLGGKLWHAAATDADLPAVGDWVALDPGGEGDEVVIRGHLPRRSRLSRKLPGKSATEQVIAANVDLVVVVTDPGADFSPRRVERYLVLIERGGARPVILLNKSDLFGDDECAEAVDALREVCGGADVCLTSALGSEGVEVLRGYLSPGATMVLVGSSGVGKSTLVNQLLGRDLQETSDVNEVTGRGRHTTIARELIVLEGGGILIDTPGVRELQMWTDEATLRERFVDVEELASQCRFHDCKHRDDAGCAIRAALDSGELDPGRYESFLNLEEEVAELKRRQKKRRMTVERRAKRNRKVKARNLADRIDLEKEERGEL